MAVCFVLVLTALLYCGSYLVKTIREYISLSLPGISVDGLIGRILKSLFTHT